MPLEAVCVVFDNSEYNRNGDFVPSRWESQNDAAQNIIHVKMQQNPENTVAVMSMAGRRVEVHISQSREIDDILSSAANIPINGEGNFMTSVKVAQLSLKHRLNKNAKPRIVIFCGHPLKEDQAEFETLGKRLRQNNVAIDVINFANPDNVPKLQTLVDSANRSDNCHFLDVPPGANMITDVLFMSPILQGDDFGAQAMGGAPADGQGGMVVDQLAGPGAGQQNAPQPFGADLAMNDPELAEALRISMEEANARRAEEEKKADGGAQGAGAINETIQDGAAGFDAAVDLDGDDSHDEEYYIEQAKKLSMMPAEEPAADDPGAPVVTEPPEQQVNVKDVVDTDFMKNLVEEIGLDIEDGGLNQIIGEENKEEEKKEEEKKDDGKGGAQGGAQ